MRLQCRDKVLDLSCPAIMGIVNLTPDSFSDGGQLYAGNRLNQSKTLVAIEKMLNDGADIIDLGGESTRPGAAEVSEQQELERILPILELVLDRFDVLVSVDTSTAIVIREASVKGAHLINDVRALTRDGALEAAAQSRLPVCLMHMQNQPQTMQIKPGYQDVAAEVLAFLMSRKQDCLDAGIAAEQIILDPGFGFGKSLTHNLTLFNAIDQFVASGHPVLVGVSRKAMIGQMLGIEQADQRLIGSVMMAVLAAQSGATILRVHDVLETKQAIDIWRAITITEED
ncbi:MAG: dihydropteroate synthase [Porticoccaceae bacterium]|nr:dihydropteroate synthase [Porticoccaceae bacterium]MBT4211783.1 dihydropteroate synthase [Porticoccaceae bacterium]MBT5004261.1 dihydropteroate synthase [Porticoccaceae bacterium]MBT6028288.1 dihydropteroate synthase [Porticoccaceae bacterium]MBT6798610.1 dihydropteroate synthase [Porticoccaceae bacterium]